jgi:hypothetical protein
MDMAPMESANPNCPPDQPLWRWSRLISEALHSSGIDPDPTIKYKQRMEEVGFVNAHTQHIQWPVGPWPKGNREKLVGRLMIDNIRMVAKPMIIGMHTNLLGWSVEEANAFALLVEKDLTNKTGKYYGPM